MTDQSPGSTLTSSPKDSSAQTIVALAIVAGLIVISLAALCVAWADKANGASAFTVVGGAVGALATALSAPNGIASMISAAKKPAADAGAA